MPHKAVTRADLADALYQEVGLAHGDCRKLVDDVVDEIAQSLVREEQVKVSTFGSFKIRHKNERMGRNPKTGEEAVIPARRVVVFRPANGLRSRVAVRSE
jgi:integration host factor subunit alpha